MMSTLRRYFIAGLLVWIPLGITLWVLNAARGPDGRIAAPAAREPADRCALRLPRARAWASSSRWLIVLATGALAANFFGRKLLALGDSLLSHIPIVRSIYGGVKQISDTLFSPEGKAFRQRRAGALPARGRVDRGARHGHAAARGRAASSGGDQISVFVPTTPNITAGFFLVVPRADTIPLDMTVDDALKYIISMGVAEPAPRTAPAREHPLRDRPQYAAVAENVGDGAVADATPRDSEIHQRHWRARAYARALDTHENRILRQHRHPIPRQDRHALRLGPSPARPRRRDLHRPSRPRGPRASRVRSRIAPRPSPTADRVRNEFVLRVHGPRAPPSRGHREPGPAERRDRGAGPRARDPESLGHAALHDRRGARLGGGAPQVPLPRPAPRADAEGAAAAPHDVARRPRLPGRQRLHRRRDAGALQVHARGRARVPRALAHPRRPVLRAAAVAAALQAAAHGRRASTATTRS